MTEKPKTRKCFTCKKEKPLMEFMLLCGKYSIECHDCKSKRKDQ